MFLRNFPNRDLHLSYQRISNDNDTELFPRSSKAASESQEEEEQEKEMVEGLRISAIQRISLCSMYIFTIEEQTSLVGCDAFGR